MVVNSIELSTENGINFIHLPENVSPYVTLEFKNRIDHFLAISGNAFVLNFQKVKNLSHLFYWQAESLSRKLAQQGRKMFSINIAKSIMDYIQQKGFQDFLSPVLNLGEVLATTKELISKITKSKIDIKPLHSEKYSIDATVVNVISGALFKRLSATEIKVKQHAPYVKDSDPDPIYDWCFLLKLVSKPFTGSISICFDQSTLDKIKLHYSSRSFSPQALLKAQGQLPEDANKTLIMDLFLEMVQKCKEKCNFDWQSSDYFILKTERTKLRNKGSCKTFVVPFELPIGKIFLEFGLKK